MWLLEMRRKGGLQDGDEQRIPELLGLGQAAARTRPSALGVDALGEADEDPDEYDREPTSETMVAFEEAVVERELEIYYRGTRDSLVVVSTDPRGSSHHGDNTDHNRDDTPGQSDRRSMQRHMVLEGADDDEDEPGDARGGTARVNTTNVLDETGQEDAPPKGAPLIKVLEYAREDITSSI